MEIKKGKKKEKRKRNRELTILIDCGAISIDSSFRFVLDLPFVFFRSVFFFKFWTTIFSVQQTNKQKLGKTVSESRTVLLGCLPGFEV